MAAHRSTTHKPTRPAAARGGGRARVRRGNQADADKLKAELSAAAMHLFTEQGLEGVSIRAVAQRVGVSAMTPYRYFEDKAALLASLWENVLQAQLAAMSAASAQAPAGRARVAACTEAYVRFWETHPEEFRLVFQTQQASHLSERPGAAQAPVYGALLALLRDNTTGLAAELGAPLDHAKLAEDLSVAMIIGYLTGTMMNRRYPWSERDVLRATFVRQVVAAMAQCLVEGPAQVASLPD